MTDAQRMMLDGAAYAAVERREYDLVVCGGGLAGLCGAIMAARQGLRVALVQDRAVLGGNASSEVRIHTHGAGTYWPWAVETGVIGELIDEERFRNPEEAYEGSINAMADLVLYEWACREKTLELFLSTSVRGVEMAAPCPGATLRAVRCCQLGSEKEFALAGPLFVDATGDGTVAALAGAEWRMGREARSEFNEPKAPAEADRVTQGSTIQFFARDVGRPVPFVAPDWAVRYPDEESIFWRDHKDPRGGYWWIEIGSPFDTLADNETIRHELLRHALGVFDHLKNRGEHGAANLVLDWVGPIPGKRETRRIVGPVLLTENDLRSRRQWPDRVAHGGWFLDEHVPGGILAMDRRPEESAYDPDVKDRGMVGPYPIPLGALRCRDVRNLFLAGRDLSATHIALASLRVQGTCAVMGQAVGAAAAVCRRLGKRPDELAADDIAAVQQLLLKEDHYVPGVRNCDPDDLALRATATADSESELILAPPEGEPAYRWLDLRLMTMQWVPLTAERLDWVELLLDNRTGDPVEIELSLVRRKDLWDLDAVEPRSTARRTVPPGGPAWHRFQLDARIEPGLYGIAAKAAPGVFWAQPGRVGSPPPGTAVATLRASGLWRFEGQRGRWPAQALRLAPASRPFDATNVINGVARPEVWPNLWMSDPRAAGRGWPQSLMLRLSRPAEVAEVRLTFDSNLGRNLRGTPGNFVAPELVRDYRIELLTAGRWQAVVSDAGNRRRHRVHRFGPFEAEAVRLVVLATHGAPEARVYEVRIYGRCGPSGRPGEAGG